MSNTTYEYAFVLSRIQEWYEEANKAYLDLSMANFNAATLATSINNIPNVRVVLVKAIEKAGLLFFTNYNSRKSKELLANNKATLLFYWQALQRQLKIHGVVSRASVETSQKYFFSRPKESQIAAWSSYQSEKLYNYQHLLKNYQKLKRKYEEEIPYLPNWGGFVLKPKYIEFWEEGKHRLHKRTIFEKGKASQWEKYYLNP